VKILIFTEGTILMHSSAQHVSREERVEQVLNEESSVRDYENYIPISQASYKLKTWEKAGAEIYYITSRTGDQVDKILNVLKKHDFPNPENLAYRISGEDFKDVVNRIQPDVLIEDDCESIGGKLEMISPTLSNIIRTIITKEFEGIDKLSDDFKMLLL
jgi:hypothetical protein